MWDLDRFNEAEAVRGLREEIFALTHRSDGKIDHLLVGRRCRQLRDAYVREAIFATLTGLRRWISALWLSITSRDMPVPLDMPRRNRRTNGRIELAECVPQPSTEES